MENSYITRYNYQYVANRGVNTDRYNRNLTSIGWVIANWKIIYSRTGQFINSLTICNSLEN